MPFPLDYRVADQVDKARPGYGGQAHTTRMGRSVCVFQTKSLRGAVPSPQVRPEARPARQFAWMRAPEAVGDDPALHQCILAYGACYPQPTHPPTATARSASPRRPLSSIHATPAALAGSDYSLLETALLPHGVSIPSRRVMAASLDHVIWFHRKSFRADEWLLYDMYSPAASGAFLLSAFPDAS